MSKDIVTKHKALIYTRISETDQSTHSLDIQKEACKKLCEYKNFEIVDILEDDGKSGDDLNRPDMQRALAMARRKEFDRFVVWKLDRFSRRVKDVSTVLEDEFEPRGIKFVSEQEPFLNTDTPFGKAVIQILSVIAELDRANILEKTKLGQHKHMELGRYLGQPPYGYRVIKESQKLEVVPEEAKIVKKIFSWYTKENFTTRQISKELNQELIHGPIRAEWNWNTIDHMLKNKIYTGERTQKRKGGKGEPDTLRQFTCTPIIRKELFLLAEQKRKQHKASATHNLERNYLFRGIIHCGTCGKLLTPKVSKDKGEEYYSYTFRNRTKTPNRCETKCGSINEVKVARAIFHYFFTLLNSNQKSIKQIQNWLVGGDISGNKAEEAKKEIENLKVLEHELLGQYDRVTEGYEEGRTDKNKRNAKYTVIENKLAIVKNKRLINEQLLLSEEDKADRRIAFKDLAGYVQTLYAMDLKGKVSIKNFTDERIREAVDKMVREGQLSDIYVIWEKNALHVHFPVIDEDSKEPGGRLVLMTS